MADDTKGVRLGGGEEFGALSEARAALELVELEHARIERERRRIGDRLDGLLSSLRHGSVLLLFDADGELAGAEGPFEDHLGVSLSDLVARFEDFAGEETRGSLDQANEEVMALDSPGVSTSRSFLESEDNRVGFTWIHLRRHDDDENLIGTEVIGLVSPTPAAGEDVADTKDSFEPVMQQIARRLLDDSAEATIRRAIESFGSSFSVDRVTINRYEEADRAFSIMSSWLRSDTEPLAAESGGISISELPWAYSLLGAGEAVAISDHSDLPSEARAEKRIYASDGVKASLLLPMVRDDHLFGFVSIQSARQHRDWSATDVARASGFVRLLSATLARAEVENELADARGEAEAAVERAADAEARADAAEDHAKESGEKHETLSAEVEKARRRIEELEKDLEKAHEAEKKALATADDERGRADAIRKETEDLRQEARNFSEQAGDLREEAEALRKQANDARHELEELKGAGERARRSSEDNEAEVRALREELEEARKQAGRAKEEAREAQKQAEQAREEAREARRQAQQARKEAKETREPADGMLRDVAAVRDEARGLLALDRLASETGRQATAKLASLDAHEAESTVEMPGAGGRRFDPDATVEMEFSEFGKRGRSGAAGLASKIARFEDPDATVEVPRDEMALPRLLREDHGDESDLEGESTGTVESEVAAARSMARRAAGRDDESDAPDWWGVGSVDDDSDADAGDEDEEDIVVETAWSRRESSAEEMADWNTEPPLQSGALAAEETYVEDEETDVETDGGDRPAPVELPDLEDIDSEIGLQDVGGNVELYRSLLTKFRNDYVGAAAKIDNAIQKGNIEVAHLLLHAIKGVSGILGAMPLRATADELETRLIGSDPDATRAAVDDFTRALNRVLDSIATLDHAPPPGVAGAGDTSIEWGSDDESDDVADESDDQDDEDELAVSDPMVLRSYLNGLRQHLLAEKPRQCKLVMREIGARRWPPDFDEKVTELGELIDDNSFEDARGVFEGLMATFNDD